MTFSHHSHSGQFCAHAKGTLEEVVLEAIAQGFSTFGLSEHVPRWDAAHLYPEEADLGVEHLLTTFEAYLVEAHRLKAAYASQITLLVGAETELVDLAGLDKLSALLDKCGTQIEYLVGSVHHCHGIPIDFDAPTFDKALAASGSSSAGSGEQESFAALFDAYFDAQYTLLQRLKPEIIGHFDLVRLYHPSLRFADFPSAWAKATRNIAFAIEYGALFEVNASAFRKGWETAYPGHDVFDKIVELGGRFALSDDSHGPKMVGHNYSRAYAYLQQKGVQELWYLARAEEGEEGAMRGVVKRKVEGRPWECEWREAAESADEARS